MSPILKAKLEANLRKYKLFITLQKRAFLPVIGVYLVYVGKLSVLDISTIASVVLLVGLVMELPTGYFADRFGKKRSIVLGSFILAFSPLAYVFFPNYFGGLLAAVLYFGGLSFVSGAHSAFIHDTMQTLGREKEYSKFRGRAQSYSLVGNMIILGLVPISYSFDPRLPFILGFILLLPVPLLALSYSEPPISRRGSARELGIRSLFKKIPKADLVILFSIYGIVSSVFDNSSQFREILFSNLGMSVVYFGAFSSLAYLLAAIAGRLVHHLASLPHRAFYFVDILIMVISLLVVGISQNLYLVVSGFLLMAIYARNREIVAESHILSKYSSQDNKATLLSLLNFSSSFQGLWVALAVGGSLRFFGISKGFVSLGIVMGVALVLLMLMYLIIEKRKNRTNLVTAIIEN